MATRNGLIKKTALSEFASIRKVGKIAISIVDGDELISVQLTNGESEIIIASHDGKCIRFSENDVRPMGRDTQGVRSMLLNDDDYVVDMAVIKDGCEVITMTENGFGKRSSLEDYRLQQRAGKGIKAGVFNEQTGKLASLKQVADDEDIMCISDNGTIIRIHANEISRIGRDTKGVHIMRLNSGMIATIAITPSSPDEEEIDGEENAEPTADTIETPDNNE
jgi:DNA gyrase subunit A